MLYDPTVPIRERLIFDPCRICTKYTHKKEKKEKCSPKSLGTTRSIIVNNFTKKIHIVFQSINFTMSKEADKIHLRSNEF